GTDQDLKPLRDLPRLTHVDLRLSKSITDAGLVHLQGLEGITTLNLEGTRVTDAAMNSLKTLPNLLRLWLTDTDITGAGFAELEQMATLKDVTIDGTRVSAAAAAKLQKARPELRIHPEPYRNKRGPT